MHYIENIFICLSAPLCIAMLYSHGHRRRALLFLFAGMASCLVSSYFNAFLTTVMHADELTTALEISPVIEEIVKLLPVLFYLFVFEPVNKDAAESMLLVAFGFATLENVCYLSANSASHTALLLIRGFGAGAMHVVCGMFISTGLMLLWDRLSLRLAGIAAVICLAITYHAVYNVMVSQTGRAALVGYLIPVLTTFLYVVWNG